MHDEQITYASTAQDLVPPVSCEDPSPLLTPEPLFEQPEPESDQNAPIVVTVHNHPQQVCIFLISNSKDTL